MPDAVIAARQQFAFTIMFHYLFPVLTIGLAVLIAVLKTIELRTGAREYTRDQARLHRDTALRELDAAGVVHPDARARLEEIIVSVIAA